MQHPQGQTAAARVDALEIGTGALALHAARSGAALTAVDVSWPAVVTAQRAYRVPEVTEPATCGTPGIATRSPGLAAVRTRSDLLDHAHERVEESPESLE